MVSGRLPAVIERFDACLTPGEARRLADLSSPRRIQDFLDGVAYVGGARNRSPLNVLREGEAHCLDGALFAVAALRRLGFPPLIVDLLPEPGQDDDHVLAIFRQNGHYGAVAKSNFVGLRFREAVFRTLRELALSYFEDFYNVDGQKTLRAYAGPINLAAYDAWEWMWEDRGVDRLEVRLTQLRPKPLLTPAMAAALSPVDRLAYDAGMLVVNPDGLFKPREKSGIIEAG